MTPEQLLFFLQREYVYLMLIDALQKQLIETQLVAIERGNKLLERMIHEV